VQSAVVKSGSYAAQLSETSTSGSSAYVRKTIAPAPTDLDVSGDFDTTVEGASGGNVRFVRLFDSSGALVVSLYRQNGSGLVGLQYPANGPYFTTSGSVPLSTWAHVELHVVTAGSGTSTVQVWLNGSPIYQTTTASLGSAGVATVQIGNNVTAQSFTQVVDNVTVSSANLAPTPTATPIPPTSTPTVTSTPVPPTDTPVPPTATNTPVPPTATNTPDPSTSTPTPTATATGGSDPVVLAAGDIACDPTDASYNGGAGTASACQQLATGNELTGTVAVLPLGDDQYNAATLSQFQQVYDPSWGRAKAITYPASGNHEYMTAGAPGYYTYFGSAASPQDAGCTANCKGYYSYDLGAWHIIVLNSECTRVSGGCQAGSPQEQWLQADLATHPATCTLAYWHRPLFTSGSSLGDAAVHDLWVDLYNAHADLVLNGHDHDYERLAPQDPSGAADPTNGISEIIAGTGGKDHGGWGAIAANSVVRNRTTFGVLKLTLHPTSFDWQFMPDTQSGNGTFTDSGSQGCHL
jgi:hypothetical protein